MIVSFFNDKPKFIQIISSDIFNTVNFKRIKIYLTKYISMLLEKMICPPWSIQVTNSLTEKEHIMITQ